MAAQPSDLSLERLRAALDSLEDAVERRSRADARNADAAEELAIMQDDRARLAVELDGALASARALAAANASASERVAKARATIEAMLRRAGE